ncbi:unnamed protein product [Larinioides sclopetarius]|uniref:BTB domain-containing protein n=1 Tax=Larinioides sclopetarius TaxID=280406 RepID=A0AAV2BEU6_9ARAC
MFARTCSRTRLAVENIPFLHVVENFSTLKPNQKTVESRFESKEGVVLSSSLYSIRDMFGEATIVQITPSDSNYILFKGKVSLIDASGNIIACGEKDNRCDDEGKNIQKLLLSLTRQDIMSKKDEYLPDDKLSLLCECAFSIGQEFYKIEEILHGTSTAASKLVSNPVSRQNSYNTLAETSAHPGVCEDMKALYLNQHLTDVELTTKTKSFPAHKNILCARSPVFDAMMTNDMKEKYNSCIEIEDLGDDVERERERERERVQQMLLFLYSDTIESLQWENATQLYYAGDKYQIGKLKAICSSFLVENLTATNASGLLILADTHSDSDLKKSVEEFILEHEEKVFGSKEWEISKMTEKVEQAEIEAKLRAEQAKLENKLRNERTNLRRLFTISANTFDEIHRKIDKEKDIHVQYNKVVEKAERLFKVDEEIKDLINLTDEEYDTTESYRDRFTEPTAATLMANTSAGKNNCVFCDRSHPSQDCQKISNMNYEDKKEQVMRKRCCLVCLKPGHMAKKCHSSVKCLICERRHYALLCPDLRKGISSSSKNKVADEEQKSTEILLTNLPSAHEIYLKVIAVRLRHKGKEVCVRALMDDGSHRSYIEKNLVAELNLSPSGTEVLSQGLFGGGISPAAEHGRFMVTIESFDRKYSTSVALLDQPKICSNLPRIRDENLLAELASRGIKVTDVGRDTPPIRVLLGADVLGSILTGRIEVFTSGISAVETLLGWTILGLGRKRQVVNMVTLTLQNIELPKIWDLEVLDIKDPVESKEELLQFKAQTMKIMNAASFELRCWAHTGIKHLESQSVLGLKWDTETDELYCVSPETNMGISDIISKRKLLSIVNSIYDPIGFTSPATLLPKLLLQEAWRNKLDWDEELPLDMLLRYQRWAKHLDLIEKCRIPRRILYGSCEKATLHIFTDASAHGYACCAFLRCEEEGEVKVSLVSAKARVAPVQRPTIPRLELLGATIGARIASTILEAIDLPLKMYFWTDSMIVLGWITNTEPWNTFVGNRVKEIRELTKVEDWRFVPGDVNPADLPSRSCDFSELSRSQWWEGPKWLYEPPEIWPYTEMTLTEEAMTERRKTVAVNLNIDTKEHFGNRLLYFSSYPRIIRMTAWVLRFCQNIRVNSHKLTKELSYEEIQRAEEALIRIIQSEWPTNIREKYTQTIQFYEENKILKVRSRLILGEDPEDFVRPTVLPDHPIVRRLIEYTHQTLHHAGVQTTLSHLRERFWIPRGRRIVREVLLKCVTCRRYASKPVVPDAPAPLPVDRINRVAAFEVTGADLAGPISLKGGQKAWIVIFTCAVYRAIHLELVTSLSTEAFMQTMRRMFARRGRYFIQDIKGNETMDLDIVDAKHLRKRIRYLQSLRCQLRQRFQKEYLSELIRNPQSSLKRRNLSPGDIVLVGSDNTKRLNWPLGRVIELFRGKDNVERVARLRVANGEIIRPIQRIFPLEFSSPEIFDDVPAKAESASDNENQPTVSTKQSFQPEDLPKEQLETVKRTRFGRQIVPLKRLDL